MKDTDKFKIVSLPTQQKDDTPIQRMFDEVGKSPLRHVTVIGEHEDGTLFFGSSTKEGEHVAAGQILWDYERAKAAMMVINRDLEE